MKKICLIVILSLVMCLFVSCDFNTVRRIDSNVITYNEHKYILQDHTSDFFNYYYNTYDISVMSGVPLQKLCVNPLLGTVSVAWYDQFGDNILMVNNILGPGYAFYFKEGFSLPKHNEAALSKIILPEGRYEQIIEISNETKVTWSDIIDYSTFVRFDYFQDDIFWCYGLVRDSIHLYTGRFWVILYEDVFYIGAESDIDRGHNEVYYKISDDYQQIFKDAISGYDK